MSQVSFLLIFSLVFIVFQSFIIAKLDLEECRSYGFDETLFCDKCDILKEFIEDDLIVSRCLDCCKNEKDINKQEKYSKIELVISKKNLNHFKHISQLVLDKEKMSKYKNFKVIYHQYTSPQFLLYNKSNKLVSRLNIENWKAEMLEEFLESKLEK